MNRAALSITVLGLALLALVNSCIPPERTTTDVEIDLSDPIQQTIDRLAYYHDTDSLLLYFNHPNATYRYLAISAFVSLQDDRAIDSLIFALQDPVPEVVSQAALALGQQGDNKAESELIQAFVPTDSSGAWIETNKSILEAVGKVGGSNSHHYLSTISTYLPIDTSLLLGQVRGLYYFSRRNITSSQGALKCIQFLDESKYSEKISTYAAHYLANCDIKSLEGFADTLSQCVKIAENTNIKIPLIHATAKLRKPQFLNDLLSDEFQQHSVSVRTAGIDCLENFKDNKKRIHPFVIKQLFSDNYSIASAAINYLIDNGSAKYARLYWLTAKNTQLNPSISRKLYEVAFKLMPRWHQKRMASMRYELYQIYNSTENPYVKSEVILALGNNLDNLTFVSDSLLKDRLMSPITNTALAKAFLKFGSDDIIPLLGNKERNDLLKKIDEKLILLMEDQMVGSIALIAPYFRKDRYKDSEVIPLLSEIMNTLEMPADYEAIIEMDKTLKFLMNRKVPDHALNKYFLPFEIDSVEVASNILVKTELGSFIIELNKAKFSQSQRHFIDLVKKKYFDNKPFHRVVNNFVVQSGCPLGDGYGSLDYFIPSEFENSYFDESGLFGLASAGPHTESAQWFVTLQATPQLDGRYTIIGKINSGIKIIERIKPYDRILSMRIVN